MHIPESSEEERERGTYSMSIPRIRIPTRIRTPTRRTTATRRSSRTTTRATRLLRRARRSRRNISRTTTRTNSSTSRRRSSGTTAQRRTSRPLPVPALRRLLCGGVVEPGFEVRSDAGETRVQGAMIQRSVVKVWGGGGGDEGGGGEEDGGEGENEGEGLHLVFAFSRSSCLL